MSIEHAGSLNSDMPLFLQIRQRIEDMILSGSLEAGERVPSSTQLVQFYQVNHLTVLKGMNLLVDEGVIYKQRGVGMFVAHNARDTLRRRRRAQFRHEYIEPLLQEAARLDIRLADITAMITREDSNED